MRKVRWMASLWVFASLAACASADHAAAPAGPSVSEAPPADESESPSGGAALASVYATSGDETFDAWRADFTTRARAAGRDPDVVHDLLADLIPMPEAVAANFNDNQAEFVKPIWDYVKSATAELRVTYGRQKLVELDSSFASIEASYAPPREILAAIWGMETSYGRILGTFDSPRQLATLAYKGRRTRLGEEQLIATMRLLENGEVDREQLRISSWAGAVGQTQFMPGTFLVYAEDGDGDGRKDLWNSSPDALASAANYLTKAGWRAGEPWALEVQLPANMDYSLGDGTKRSVTEWRALGLVVAGGRAAADNLQAELFLPAGSHGPAFLLFDNFYVIKIYNNADSYALSIGLLADRLAQRPDLTRDWPWDIEVLGKSQIMELQVSLNSLGYEAGEADGLAGRRTRAALQSFQKDRGMVADGYPTGELLAAVVETANAL